MAVLDYPHIVRRPGDVARLERLPRIRISQIITDYLGRGWSADEIAAQYPHLTLAEIHASLAYYHDHSAEIDAEREAERSEARRLHASQPASALLQRLRAMKSQSET